MAHHAKVHTGGPPREQLNQGAGEGLWVRVLPGRHGGVCKQRQEGISLVHFTVTDHSWGGPGGELVAETSLNPLVYLVVCTGYS